MVSWSRIWWFSKIYFHFKLWPEFSPYRIEIPPFVYHRTITILIVYYPSVSGCVYDDTAKEDHNLYRRKGHNDCAGAEEDGWGHPESSAKGSAPLQQRKHANGWRQAAFGLRNHDDDSQSSTASHAGTRGARWSRLRAARNVPLLAATRPSRSDEEPRRRKRRASLNHTHNSFQYQSWIKLNYIHTIILKIANRLIPFLPPHFPCTSWINEHWETHENKLIWVASIVL